MNLNPMVAGRTNQADPRTYLIDPGSLPPTPVGFPYDRMELRILVQDLDGYVKSARMFTDRSLREHREARKDYAERIRAYRRIIALLVGPQYPARIRELRVQIALGA